MSKDKELNDSEREHAVARILNRPLIGNYIVIAECYESDGSRMLAVQTSPNMVPHLEIGMLTSCLNRANMIDKQGWQCDCGEDHDYE